MEFIHYQTMVPMRWRHYTTYRIDTIDNFIKQLAPDYSGEILKETKLRVLDELGTDFWWPILNSKIIVPDLSAVLKEYDLWADADKPNSFDDFANLFKNGTIPQDKEVLSWVNGYGVPYFDIPPFLFEKHWNAKSKPAIALQRGLIISKILRTTIDRVLFNNQTSANTSSIVNYWKKSPSYAGRDNLHELAKDLFERTRHIMLVDVFIELAREAFGVNNWYYSLRNGQMPKLEPDEERVVFPINNPLPKNISPETMPIAIWHALRDRVLSRFHGVNITLQISRNAKVFPFFDVRQAYIAQNLLSVMWARFYNRLQQLTPTGKCQCGAFFTMKRPNQKFCTPLCKDKYNTRKFREKNGKKSSQ